MKVRAISHKTGAYFEMTYFPRSGNKNSYVQGIGYEANGNPVIEVTGSWLSHLELTDKRTGLTEVVWREPPLIPDAHLQFFFNHLTAKMNQRTDDMKGFVCHTDTRWREDI